MNEIGESMVGNDGNHGRRIAGAGRGIQVRKHGID